MINADHSTLEKEIATNDLVLVDFWASWCAPCRAVAPMLVRLAEEFPKLRIVKVDADANKDLLDEYGVQSLPSVTIYRSGKKVEQLFGKMPYALIRRAVEKAN